MKRGLPLSSVNSLHRNASRCMTEGVHRPAKLCGKDTKRRWYTGSEATIMSTAGTSDHGRIAAVYTLLAIVYDIWTWFTESKSLHTAVSSAAISNGEAVLEVAVGTGVVFREILRQNPSGRNIGIDITKAM